MELPFSTGTALFAVGSLALLIWILIEVRRRDHARLASMADSLRDELRHLSGRVDEQLAGGREAIDRRLSEANRAVGDVRRELGAVDRHLGEVRDATRDLQRLDSLLRAPQLRGGLGEHLLAELLAQVLPQASFALQHTFRDGTRVDAVIRVGDRLVSVDSKFPLDNLRQRRDALEAGDTALAERARRDFRRDFRRHVDAIADRYIRPGEGTYEFAMLYLPAEGIHHEILIDPDADDLLHYALSRRVVPVSPRSFYAYLQVLLTGLKGLQVEQRAREWVDGVAQLERDLSRVEQSLDTLGKHLLHAQRQTEEVRRRVAGTGASVRRLSGVDEHGEVQL